MPTIDDLIGGEYLSAADFPRGQGHAQELHVASWQLEDFPEGTKLVIGFREREGLVVLNKINLRSIADGLGKDYSTWIGQPVMVYNDPTVCDPRGKVTGGIRIYVQDGANVPVDEFDAAEYVKRHQRLLKLAKEDGDQSAVDAYLEQARREYVAGRLSDEELRQITDG